MKKSVKVGLCTTALAVAFCATPVLSGCGAVENDTSELNSKIETLQTENAQLTTENANLTAENQSQAAQIDSILESLNSNIESLQELLGTEPSEQIRELSARINELTTANNNLTTSNANLTQVNSNLTATNDTLRNTNQEQAGRITDLTVENATLKIEKASLTAENTTQANQINDLTTANTNLTNENASLTNANEELTTANEALSATNEAQANQITNLQSLMTNLNKEIYASFKSLFFDVVHLTIASDAGIKVGFDDMVARIKRFYLALNTKEIKFGEAYKLTVPSSEGTTEIPFKLAYNNGKYQIYFLLGNGALYADAGYEFSYVDGQIDYFGMYIHSDDKIKVTRSTAGYIINGTECTGLSGGGGTVYDRNALLAELSVEFDADHQITVTQEDIDAFETMLINS